MLALSLVVALSGVAQVSTDKPAENSAENVTPVSRSLIDIFVFENGAPVPDVEIRLGSALIGKTDAVGGLSVQIPSGRQNLLMFRHEEKVVDLDLLTDKGELVQIIVTLRAGEKAVLDIENSGRSSVLAGERLAARAADGQQDQQEVQAPGALRGTITSIEDQKPVVRARLFFSGLAIEAETDNEGAFAVELPAGSYSVSVVHPDYATQTKDNVRVIPAREVTLTLELTPAGLQLADYVVTAPYVEGSIASTIEAQRETSAVSEVLGAEQMAAAGDSDAAEALQRVSGLLIEQGKYVLVRGQNFRYTYTTWNGSPLPSPEPLLRVVPLDLFPTGVLSGIEVQKSYSPDRPAEFGGGLIDLQTRGIPSEAFLSLTVSSGLNTFSAFSDGLTYEGGGSDIFGFDDGTRAIPDEIIEATNDGENILRSPPLDSPEQVNMIAQSFNNIYNLDPTTLPPDFGLTIAGGGSFDIFWDGTFGAIASVKWNNRWRRQRRIQNAFVRVFDNDNNPVLVAQNRSIENRTDFNSDIGGLLTLSAEWEGHQLNASTFYAHQTQQRSELTSGEFTNIDSRPRNEEDFELSWIDRTLVAQQVTGSHELFDGLLKLEYRGVYAEAIRDAPDRRTYDIFDLEGGAEQFFSNVDRGITRRFNEVDDSLLSGMADLSITPFDPEESWLGLTLKTGAAWTTQNRNVLNREFLLTGNTNADVLELDPEVLYNSSEIGDTVSFRDQSDSRRDDSEGFIDVLGLYGMADIRLGDILRVVGGVRYEDVNTFVRTFNTNGDGEEGPASYRRKEWFPAVSTTWFILDELQLRAAYGKTTSRPSLNELSDAVFINPDTGENFIGRRDLVPATIDGVEGRLEWYPTPTESLTLGAFWKGYTDPIEQILQTRAGGSGVIFTFENSRRADVFGVEFGGRVEFSHIREWLGGPEFIDNIYVMANVAFLFSSVQVSGDGIDIPGRELTGQADYTLNAQAGYAGEDHDITIAFNQVGPRLFRVALSFPVIQQAIPTLDLTWTWRIWDEDYTAGTFRLGASNLIDPKIEWRRGEELWRQFNRGRTFSASFKIAFQ